MNKLHMFDQLTKFCPGKIRRHLWNSLFRTAPEDVADSMTLSNERVDMFTSLRRIAKSGYEASLIIDVGAHEGMFSKRVSRIFPEAKFIMFEGNPDKIQTLSLCAAQDESRFSVYGVLLGAESGHVQFHVMHGETGSSVLLEKSRLSYRTIVAEQVRLSDVLDPKSRPSIIKLDVQGYESQVIMGIDQNHLPDFFLCELSLLPLNDGVPDFDFMVRLFADLGYVLYDVCGITRRPLDSATWQIDGLFLRREAELRNRLETGYGLP